MPSESTVSFASGDVAQMKWRHFTPPVNARGASPSTRQLIGRTAHWNEPPDLGGTNETTSETRYQDGMSPIAWVILAAVLTPISAGVVVGVIRKPHGPWDGAFESAAYATGAVVAPLVLAAIALMLAHPSNEHGDQEAGVQVVFIGVLAIPLYVPAFVGSAIGKLLGRRFRRPD